MGVVVLWIIIAIAVATTTTILLRLRGVRRGWANDVAEKIVRVHPFVRNPPSGSRTRSGRDTRRSASPPDWRRAS
jgi:hypothetical protein